MKQMSCLLKAPMETATHPPRDEAYKDLERIVNDTCKRGGKVIVPAFAVGRTQELVYCLHQSVDRRDVPPDLPIYVDSPLAIDATAIYRLHPEAYDEEVAEFLENDRHGDPFWIRHDALHKDRARIKGAQLFTRSGRDYQRQRNGRGR